MPRIAALYDIHGNLPALEAALAASERDEAELLVFGGDLVPGPMLRETIDLAMALADRSRFVRGNCDRMAVETFDGRPPERLPAAVRETFEWAASQLDRRHRDFLASFARTVVIDVDGIGDVLFCHATPSSDEPIFTARTPDERVRTLLGGATQALVVCGHTHMQFDRAVGGTRVVNAGSVGMAFGEPGAHWLLLGPDVRLVRTAYDLGRAAALVRETRYPGAEDFAARNVLAPPTEEEMLVRFEAVSG